MLRSKWSPGCTSRRRCRPSSSPTRCTRMSCGSSPKLTNSTIAGPGFTLRRESAYQNSFAVTCTRVGNDFDVLAPAGAGASTDERRERRGSRDPHLSSCRTLVAGRARKDGVRVGVEPLLEHRGVDRPEVGRRLQVAEAVEPAGDAGEASRSAGRSPSCRSGTRCRPSRGRSRPRRSRRARRPNSDQTWIEHAVGDPAGLEVALEGEQRVGRRAAARCSAWRPASACVSKCPGEVIVDDPQRQPGGDHRRKAGEPVRERVGRGRVGDRA